MPDNSRLRKITQNYKDLTGEELQLIDASRFQSPSFSLTSTLINLVEREGPRYYAHRFMHEDLGMLLRQMRAICSLLVTLNVEEKMGTADHNQQHTIAFLPLIRNLIDCHYNITALLDDPSRALKFRASGYRAMLEETESDRKRYGTDRRYLDHAARVYSNICIKWRRIGLTEEEVRSASNWPPLSRYLRTSPKDTRHKNMMRSLTLGYWKEYSSLAHGAFEGLHDIAMYLIKDKIPHEIRDTVEHAGERAITIHMGRAFGVLLATLTELQAHYRFVGFDVNNRLHLLWDELNIMPEIRELYECYYKDLISRAGLLRTSTIPSEFRSHFGV